MKFKQVRMRKILKKFKTATVSIYMLLNPTTLKPFYVGVTKHTLDHRLRQHLTDAKSTKSYNIKKAKNQYIKQLIENGNPPTIVLIQVVPINEAKVLERKYYDELIRMNYVLLNSPDAFCYSGNNGWGKI